MSKSDDARRLPVQVLNRTVEDAHADQLRWHGKHNYLYFRATDDLSPLTIKVDGGYGRTIFSAYPSKRDPSRVAYYRHYALERQFLQLDGVWYLELNPTYHFTWNGYNDSRWAPSYSLASSGSRATRRCGGSPPSGPATSAAQERRACSTSRPTPGFGSAALRSFRWIGASTTPRGGHPMRAATLTTTTTVG